MSWPTAVVGRCAPSSPRGRPRDNGAERASFVGTLENKSLNPPISADNYPIYFPPERQKIYGGRVDPTDLTRATLHPTLGSSTPTQESIGPVRRTHANPSPSADPVSCAAHRQRSAVARRTRLGADPHAVGRSWHQPPGYPRPNRNPLRDPPTRQTGSPQRQHARDAWLSHRMVGRATRIRAAASPVVSGHRHELQETRGVSNAPRLASPSAWVLPVGAPCAGLPRRQTQGPMPGPSEQLARPRQAVTQGKADLLSRRLRPYAAQLLQHVEATQWKSYAHDSE